MSFGQMGFRPNEISAKRAFGQTSFGQTRLARKKEDWTIKEQTEGN
jgi:hypothetical protein